MLLIHFVPQKYHLWIIMDQQHDKLFPQLDQIVNYHEVFNQVDIDLGKYHLSSWC